jgi:hypothetical protein
VFSSRGLGANLGDLCARERTLAASVIASFLGQSDSFALALADDCAFKLSDTAEKRQLIRR